MLVKYIPEKPKKEIFGCFDPNPYTKIRFLLLVTPYLTYSFLSYNKQYLMSYREIIKSNVMRREKAITGVSRRNQAFDKACKFVCMGVFFLT